MMKVKYGAGGYHLTETEIDNLKTYTLGIIASLSQNKTYPADVILAKSFAQNICEILGIEVVMDLNGLQG